MSAVKDPETMTNGEVWVLYKSDYAAYVQWLKSVTHVRCQEFLAFARHENETFIKDVADSYGVSTEGILPKKN